MAMRRERKRKREDEAMGVDRISQLPDSIVHGILSLLSPKNAARTSILSKAWRRMFSTNPFLAFDISYLDYFNNYRAGDQRQRAMDEEALLELVDDCVQRRLLQIPNVHAFKLRALFIGSESLAGLVDRWVATALDRNVVELDLEIPLRTHFCLLPMTVPVAKSLRVLTLSYCKLNSNRQVKLPQLQKLSLYEVYIEEDDQFFDNLAFHCPSIEVLDLSLCRGLSRLHLGPTLLRLKHVCLHSCFSKFNSIEIKAPNLCIFSFSDQGFWPGEFGLPGCRDLQTLELKDAGITDQAFQKLMTELPELEALELHSCSLLRRIKISSQKLRRLILHECLQLSVADIDTPNLLSVSYVGYKMPIHFLNTSHLLNVDIEFLLHGLDFPCLEKLKDFLIKSSHSEEFKLVVYHSLSHYREMFIHEKLNDVLLSPLYHLKDFSPRVYITSRSNRDLIDLVFQFQPKTLTVVSHHSKLSELVCERVEKAMNRRELSPPRRDRDQHRGRQCLMYGFQVFPSKVSVYDAWKSFLNAHSIVPYQTTKIRLNWEIINRF